MSSAMSSISSGATPSVSAARKAASASGSGVPWANTRPAASRRAAASCTRSAIVSDIADFNRAAPSGMASAARSTVTWRTRLAARKPSIGSSTTRPMALRGMAQQPPAVIVEDDEAGVEEVEIRPPRHEADESPSASRSRWAAKASRSSARTDTCRRPNGGMFDDACRAAPRIEAARAGQSHRDGAVDPFGEIMIAAAPRDLAVRVSDAAKHGLEAGRFARERCGEHELAIGHAVEGIVAHDELLGQVRSADQRVGPVGPSLEGLRDEGDPRAHGQAACLLDQIAQSCPGTPRCAQASPRPGARPKAASSIRARRVRAMDKSRWSRGGQSSR